SETILTGSKGIVSWRNGGCSKPSAPAARLDARPPRRERSEAGSASSGSVSSLMRLLRVMSAHLASGCSRATRKPRPKGSEKRHDGKLGHIRRRHETAFGALDYRTGEEE